MIAVGLALIWASYTLFWLAVVRFYSMPIGIMELIVPGRYDLCKFHQDFATGKDIKLTGGCGKGGGGSSATKPSPSPSPQPNPGPNPKPSPKGKGVT